MSTLSAENAGRLLEIVEQRRQHLSSMIHNLNWLAVTLISGVWTFFITGFLEHSPFVNPNINVEDAHPFTFSYIIMAAGISSLILMLWRLYSRYLDSQISELYPEILKYERILGVSKTEGVAHYLARSNKNIENALDRLDENKHLEFITQLVRDRHVGRRGTLFIDKLVIVAFITFVGLVITDLIFLCQSGQLEFLFKFDDINRIPIIASKLLGYLAIFSSSVIHISITLFRFQRDPKDKHVNKIIASLESVEQAEKS